MVKKKYPKKKKKIEQPANRKNSPHLIKLNTEEKSPKKEIKKPENSCTVHSSSSPLETNYFLPFLGNNLSPIKEKIQGNFQTVAIKNQLETVKVEIQAPSAYKGIHPHLLEPLQKMEQEILPRKIFESTCKHPKRLTTFTRNLYTNVE